MGNLGYAPCADAALHLVRDILPRIRSQLGQVQTTIVGIDPPEKLLKLNASDVHVTGRVADIVPYYMENAVCVTPLRAGGGTRLKILEAMALGRPVVSTTIGCEGLDVTHGRHLLVSDDPGGFADCVVRLLTDSALYRRIAAEARSLVETAYDWETSRVDCSSSIPFRRVFPARQPHSPALSIDGARPAPRQSLARNSDPSRSPGLTGSWSN